MWHCRKVSGEGGGGAIRLGCGMRGRGKLLLVSVAKIIPGQERRERGILMPGIGHKEGHRLDSGGQGRGGAGRSGYQSRGHVKTVWI